MSIGHIGEKTMLNVRAVISMNSYVELISTWKHFLRAIFPINPTSTTTRAAAAVVGVGNRHLYGSAQHEGPHLTRDRARRRRLPRRLLGRGGRIVRPAAVAVESGRRGRLESGATSKAAAAVQMASVCAACQPRPGVVLVWGR